MFEINYNLLSLLRSQVEWSTATFGDGPRVSGIVDHIKRELVEIEADPNDVFEWIDVVILALDGAWRAGHTPEAIVAALNEKYEINRNREWPAIEDQVPDEAVQHVEPSDLDEGSWDEDDLDAQRDHSKTRRFGRRKAEGK